MRVAFCLKRIGLHTAEQWKIYKKQCRHSATTDHRNWLFLSLQKSIDNPSFSDCAENGKMIRLYYDDSLKIQEMKTMNYVGIDIGSTAAKVVTRGEVNLEFVLPTGWSSK